MNVSPQNTSERPGLLRGLGLWAAVAVVIGDTIGSGIFLVPSAMAAIVGSESLVFAAWVVGGLIVLCGAFCYAELGATFPKAGGPYAYLNNGLGPLWGFLFGWMSAFLERPVAMATLAAGFARFLGFLFPAAGAPLFTLHLFGGEFAVTMAQPLAALVVILVTGGSGVLGRAVVDSLLTAGHRVRVLDLQEGAVQDQRVELVMGSQNFSARMQNFLDHYPEIRRRSGHVRAFDLRLDDRITAGTRQP